MTIIFVIDGGEYTRIKRAETVPLPGHEVWFGRKRYYVSDVPRWVIEEPGSLNPNGGMEVEIELTRLSLREDPK